MYNVKTCMYAKSALYQIINFSASTLQLRPTNIKFSCKVDFAKLVSLSIYIQFILFWCNSVNVVKLLILLNINGLLNPNGHCMQNGKHFWKSHAFYQSACSRAANINHQEESSSWIDCKVHGKKSLKDIWVFCLRTPVYSVSFSEYLISHLPVPRCHF